MSDKRYEANIIRATAVEPANNLQSTSAPGVWSIDEVVELQKKSKWPTVGNVITNVENVLSTFLYEGTGSAQTITNNINLSGEGGLVWTKSRSMSSAGYHQLIDTVRGAGKFLASDLTQGENTDIQTISAFNSTGYAIGNDAQVNTNNETFVSWTFRKQAKFFDIVTFTGNGTAGRTVAHNLGSVPGMIIVKCTSESQHWAVYHRSQGATKYGILSNRDAFSAYAGTWNNTEPTSTAITLGTDSWVNGNGKSYVAYIFAHNNNDGGFGSDQDEDIIKCGTYNGTNAAGNEINLGFEPQWLFIKASTKTDDWFMLDNMRGLAVGGTDNYLQANTSVAEAAYGGSGFFDLTPTGFKSASSALNESSQSYIYMAIRRPQAVPTAATQVFGISTNGQAGDSKAPAYRSTFPVDFYFEKSTAGSPGYISSRLTGSQYMQTNATNAEATDSVLTYDYMNGVYNSTGSNSALYGWMWKRARGYFDVVCYTGTGSARTVSHNLGVAPEMMWVKCRDGPGGSGTAAWVVYHKDSDASAPQDKYLYLDTSGGVGDFTGYWNDTAPTSTVFTLGTGNGNDTNASGQKYIAYLFATLPGITKLGKFSTTGSDVNVDCGFSSGAKFILIKRTDGSGAWNVFDTVRGIVAGNDPFIKLNTTAAQSTGSDVMDPLSSGFTVVGGGFSAGEDFIFYAIAT